MNLFKPLLAGARPIDRMIAGLGAAIGISLTILVCSQLPLHAGDLPIIVAPLGASAVLIFAVPASPLAQPWSVVGGNILSSLIGVAAYQLIPDMMVAAGVAVGVAIILMSLLRCLHPPGGAAALTAVIGSQGIHDAGYAFAFAPVGINSIALVSLGLFFHRLSGHSYPHQPVAPPVIADQLRAEAGFHLEDIDKALAELPDNFDISRADLDLLLSRAEIHAQARRAD
ncbi:HPP family protein [Sphingobium sp. PAMC28499]|jgi:CBS domain-containing membrane protein|uniref:HPP family protein n=1 Tax=Sphingobium sp. PAMC28499 TaxID=2565554 RepID=UPI00109DE391|nr:HPP family protein [Sphingobium sp. PAMC28499]QCB37474.1 HPP family protein [Sphingobium sp. PAMC28499]